MKDEVADTNMEMDHMQSKYSFTFHLINYGSTCEVNMKLSVICVLVNDTMTILHFVYLRISDLGNLS